MSIGTSLAALQTAKNNIASAITAKGGVVNAGDGMSDFAADIASIPSGGGTPSASPKDVNFYDYDGTIVYSYTAAEFASLSALPANPTHGGLTAQGWNYTLSDAKSYVASYGKLDIGQTYITDDGKTRLYIHIATEGRMTVPLYFSQTVANGVTIDWGDGGATQTLAGTGNKNTTHVYTATGSYVISLNPVSGCTLGLGWKTSSYCVMGATSTANYVYCNMLQKAEVGSGVTSIGACTFEYCYSLNSVTIPVGVTSIGENAFYYCHSLSSVTIPVGVTSIGYSAFDYCYSLNSVTIPVGVTSIGAYTFEYCYSLNSVTIPVGVTNIFAGAFRFCYGVAIYDFTACTAVPTLANANAFTDIASDCIMRIPSALYSAWSTATNWSTYASYMVAV